MEKVENRIIKPTINGLAKDNIPYKGFIFFGLMNVNGDPFVIEYNVRMGDPEAESVIPRIKTDLLELFEGIANNNLEKCSIETDPRYSVAVMLVSKGYPGSYEKGKEILGLDITKDCIIFHAGTITDNLTGKVKTNGGRVLAVTSYGDTLNDALKQSFKNANVIQFYGKNFRNDIGKDLLA